MLLKESKLGCWSNSTVTTAWDLRFSLSFCRRFRFCDVTGSSELLAQWRGIASQKTGILKCHHYFLFLVSLFAITYWLSVKVTWHHQPLSPYSASVIPRYFLITEYHFSLCPELTCFYSTLKILRWKYLYTFVLHVQLTKIMFVLVSSHLLSRLLHCVHILPLRLITLKNRVCAWKLQIWTDMG